MDYAAQCSNLGYSSVKPLLESRAQPWAVDFLMEVACYLKNAVTAGCDLESTFFIFVSPEVIICPETGTRLVDAIPCWMDGRNVVTAIVLSS